MSFSGRLLIQNCESAELELNWDQIRAGEQSEVQKCEIKKGLVIFVCFRESTTDEILPKMIKTILTTKIVQQTDAKPGEIFCKNLCKILIFGVLTQIFSASVVDTGGAVMIIPQATLGGKIKSKQIQYHGNIKKDIGHTMYNNFCTLLLEQSDKTDTKVVMGTYGNRQVLRMDTEGPFSHVIDF